MPITKRLGCVRQLLSFIETLKLEKVSLVGNSLGGAASIGAALAAPDNIDNLVLMGTGGRRRPGETSASFQALHSFDNEKEHMRQIIRNLTNPDFHIDESMVEYRMKKLVCILQKGRRVA